MFRLTIDQIMHPPKGKECKEVFKVDGYADDQNIW